MNLSFYKSIRKELVELRALKPVLVMCTRDDAGGKMLFSISSALLNFLRDEESVPYILNESTDIEALVSLTEAGHITQSTQCRAR